MRGGFKTCANEERGEQLRVLSSARGESNHQLSDEGVGALVQMSPLRERLRRFASSWTPPLRAELIRYVRSRRIQPLNRKGGPTPHYVLLPVWLLRRYRPKQSSTDRLFLNDVLWGQFCVYLAFRIQDDLIDRGPDHGLQVLAADLLLLESVRTFSLHFPGNSRFWGLYFESLESTVQGAARVDSLQRSRQGSVGTLLREYARVCAIFTIGASAVCIWYSRMRDLDQARHFWNEMAIAGQLLDDFEDLEEDWRRGRFNSVAKIMLGKRLSPLAQKGLALTAVKKALMAGGFDRIAEMVLQRIDRAEAALKPIRGEAPYPGFRDYRKNIDRIRRTMHRESVRSFFSRFHGT